MEMPPQIPLTSVDEALASQVGPAKELLEGQRVLRQQARMEEDFPEEEDEVPSEEVLRKARGRGRGGKGRGRGRGKAKPMNAQHVSPCPGPAGFQASEDPRDRIEEVTPPQPVKRRLEFGNDVPLDPAHDSQKPLTPPEKNPVKKPTQKDQAEPKRKSRKTAKEPKQKGNGKGGVTSASDAQSYIKDPCAISMC